MSASTPSQTVFSIGYDFHIGNGTSGADNGNVWGIYNYRDRSRDQSFTYDALNRLTSGQNAGTNCAANTVNGKTEYWGNSYGYDAWGNLLQKNVTKCGAESLVVTADAHNWIHATGSSDYKYDAAGNMTFNATPPTQNYTYDQENRLIGAAGYTYTYDSNGNRVIKSNGSTGTLYWYMTPGIVGESDLSGNLTDEYVFFGGERVARKSTNGVFYYFSDHLKTASVITDSLGNIKSESDFYPWGGELQFVNNDSNHYKFTGKERDAETQLDYFGARHYSYGLGRWISADWSPTPIPVPYADFHDPQSLNLYSYTRNTPATHFDVDGHVSDLLGGFRQWLQSHTRSGEKSGEKSLENKTATAGPLTVNGKVASATGTLSGAVSPVGATGKAEGKVSAAGTTITVTSHSETKIDALTAKGELSGTLGLTGKGSGVALSGGAHADVLSGSTKLTVGPVTVEATGEVGAGAEIGGSVTNSGANFHIGLAPGVGGDVSISVNWGGNTGVSSSVSKDSQKETKVTPMKVDK
jgi:RHS repeat-associated protein